MVKKWGSPKWGSQESLKSGKSEKTEVVKPELLY